MQGKNRDEDIENGFVDTVREGEGGAKWESSIDTYIYIYIYVFPSSLFISFPSSNLQDLTEYVFLKEMKSVHSCSNK